LLKKVLNKNIYYNFLSLFNIAIAFFFTIAIGKIFGVGEKTDIYFSAIAIIAIIGTLVKAIWEAFSPDFIKLKIENTEKSKELYSILLNNIILVSIIIILIYYLITSTISIINYNLKEFLDIFIIYLLIQNILYFNKIVLNLEHYYSLYYLVDIFIYLSSLMIIFSVNSSLTSIAIIFIITSLIAVVFQFFIIFRKLNYYYKFKIYNDITKTIFINSFKYRSGTFIYSLKDLLILYFFNNLGTGYYTLYSYANKFALTISQIVNAPIINIFMTKLNYKVGENDYRTVNKLVKNVLFQTIPLFVIASSVLYFILPFIMKNFLKEITDDDIINISNIFLWLVLFNFIIVLETPFAKSVIIFKEFNFCLYLNMIFIIIFSIGFLFTFKLETYWYLLFVLIFAQLTNTIFYIYKYTNYLKGK
jgi:O-antigen/teichoic acid export membrane protein